MARINMIVAASENLVIGNENKLPWRLSTDMDFFKRMTEGSVVIMGRNTWESLPKSFRPLPKRTNIVVTNNHEYVASGAIVTHNLVNTIKAFKDNGIEEEVFIIGGSKIYEQSFGFVDRVLLTKVYGLFQGDTYLRGFDSSLFGETIVSDVMEENGHKFKFITYEKLVF